MQQPKATDNHLNYVHHYYQHLVTLIVKLPLRLYVTYIIMFVPSVTGMAHKECLENGTWFRHPSSGQVWSNYTTCINIDDLNVSFIVVIFSLVTLL